MSEFQTNRDVAAQIGRWLGYLGSERRMSGKTLEAYRRDVAQFLDFLTGHLGNAPTLKQLAKLTQADVRAFMAARRSAGAGNRTLMRSLAGTRSFARFLERNGKGTVAALTAVRTPKLPRTLPKPLAISAARQIADIELRAGEAREPWIIARDAAVLALLYGSGLRISEALSMKRNDFREAADSITVTGKGNKARMVPLLPQVAKAIADYIATLPNRTATQRCIIRRRASAPALAPDHPIGDGTPAWCTRPCRYCNTACPASFIRNAPAGARR